MNYRFILQTLGKAILIEATALTSALAVALYYAEDTYKAFAIAIVFMLCIGGAMIAVKLKEKQVRPLDGLVVVSLCWISLTFLGALPFMLSGSIPSLADAVFETASGLTTTGASIIEDFSGFGRAELYWRSLTNWIGGMGVIVLLLTLTNKGSKGVLHVLRAEVPGPTVEKIVPKMRQTAIILYRLYIIITLAEVIMLWIFGLSFYESLVLSFATAGTGGFTITALSVGAYSPAIHWIVGVFMIAFGINFSVYFYMMLGKFGKVWRHEETRAFLFIVFASVALITWNILPLYQNGMDALRDAFFQTTSIVSTSGFATTDFNLWPMFSKAILVALMLIGASSGSTAGGLKVSRLLILLKAAKIRVLKIVNNNTYRVVKLDGALVDETVVNNTLVYFTIFSFFQFISFVILSLDNKDFVTTSTAVIACFNNIGPGLGEVGPTGNFAMFSDWAKWLLSLDMLLGRLEIYPLVVLFGRGVRSVTNIKRLRS